MNLATISLQIISFLRFNVLLAAKGITLVTCLFYISKYQEYEVKMGFFRDILPTKIVQFFDNTFGLGGTTILMIPTTIIILSFLIDHPLVKIMSAFTAVFGTIFSIVRGFFHGVLGEITNYGLFMVRHIETLQKKREWFDLEIDRYYLEMQDLAPQKLAFFTKCFSDHDYITYDNALMKLNNAEDVKIYALTVLNKLSAQYDAIPKPKVWYTKFGYFIQDIITSPAFLVASGITLVGLGLFVWMGGPEAWKNIHLEQALLSKEGALHSVISQTVSTSTLEISQKHNVLQALVISLSTKVTALTLWTQTKTSLLETKLQETSNLMNQTLDKTVLQLNNDLYLKQVTATLIEENQARTEDIKNLMENFFLLKQKTTNMLLEICSTAVPDKEKQKILLEKLAENFNFTT